MPIQRVLEAIEEIKQGKMVIMVDDEDRENEGDLVYAATFSTPEKVNFLVKEARGLVCVAVEKETSKRLELNPMVPHNTSSYETAFTVSVDAASAATGISAGERDTTIKLLADPYSKAEDLVRPGHIFPLTAKEGGVLNRIGHTEGSVDLCKLAGLNSAAVICEIMKEDGDMARRDDLEVFAKKHDLKIVQIADLVQYRLERESLIECINEEEVNFFNHTVQRKNYRDHLNRTHSVLAFGEIGSHTNVKFHNIGTDLALLCNLEQYNGMIESIEYLKKEGGLLVFLDNTHVQDTKIKEFGIGAQILKALAIKTINLISTRKMKEFSAISGFDLEIKEEIILR